MSADEPYASGFVEEALGLPAGMLSPSQVPVPLRNAVLSSVAGDEAAVSAAPAVDGLVNAFRDKLEAEALESTGLFASKAKWPGGAPFAACLTHDVDTISRPISQVLERRTRFAASDLLLAMAGARSLYDNIDYVASMESARNVRSSFYLLSSGYDLASVSAEVGRLLRGGWEVGLHGDFGTHDSLDAMRAAVEKLKAGTGVVPEGLREHYLRFDYGKTWEIAEEAGFAYDTSVGNRDKLGFRIGVSTPFHPPSRGGGRMKILELPMALMDTTLWGYLKLDEEKGLEEARSLIESVSKVNGLFTLLWHQESVRMKGGRIYPKLVDELVKRKAFVAGGAAIANWWRARAAPLRMAERGAGFDVDDAPKGLCVNFRAKADRKATVTGGKLVKGGASGAAVADGGKLTVRFEG